MLDKNLKYLRQKNKISQQMLSEALEIPRSTLGDYERGKTEPNISMLIRLGDYFDVRVDQLIREDLSHGDYEIMKTKLMKVLAISVDKENEGNIELVDTKAEAGYLDSYQNPEYIRDLPKLQLPQLPAGTYRAFEIQGDSMLPIESGSIIIASYVESLANIKDNRTYVIISKHDGLVYKRVLTNHDRQVLILISDNELFLPYDIPMSEIAEIWQYHCHLTYSDEKGASTKMEAQLGDIQRKVTTLYELASSSKNNA